MNSKINNQRKIIEKSKRLNSISSENKRKDFKYSTFNSINDQKLDKKTINNYYYHGIDYSKIKEILTKRPVSLSINHRIKNNENVQSSKLKS